MLEPLKQWYCDGCGGIINSSEDGYLEWIGPIGAPEGFKVIHNTGGPSGSCSHYVKHRYLKDMPLTHYTGENALAALLPFFDVGEYLDPDGNSLNNLKDQREFVELIKRLLIPYYEDARLHFHEASYDGLFDGANEVTVSQPRLMKEIAEKYST